MFGKENLPAVKLMKTLLTILQIQKSLRTENMWNWKINVNSE